MPVQSAFQSVQHRDWVLPGESLGSLIICMTLQSLYLVEHLLCGRWRAYHPSWARAIALTSFPFNSTFIQNILCPFFPSLSDIFLWVSSPVLWLARPFLGCLSSPSEEYMKV